MIPLSQPELGGILVASSSPGPSPRCHLRSGAGDPAFFGPGLATLLLSGPLLRCARGKRPCLTKNGGFERKSGVFCCADGTCLKWPRPVRHRHWHRGPPPAVNCLRGNGGIEAKPPSCRWRHALHNALGIFGCAVAGRPPGPERWSEERGRGPRARHARVGFWGLEAKHAAFTIASASGAASSSGGTSLSRNAPRNKKSKSGGAGGSARAPPPSRFLSS